MNHDPDAVPGLLLAGLYVDDGSVVLVEHNEVGRPVRVADCCVADAAVGVAQGKCLYDIGQLSG